MYNLLEVSGNSNKFEILSNRTKVTCLRKLIWLNVPGEEAFSIESTNPATIFRKDINSWTGTRVGDL